MQNNQENEVKFYLNDLAGFEKNLQGLGAELIQPRVHEVNLRFDTPQGDLSRAHRVLRLRQDEKVRLTYKSPAAASQQEVSSRQEIEFEADSFENARLFLEALGYEVMVSYEKFRATYQLNTVQIMLDEMPFGNFIEIEGPDPHSIQTVAAVLHLNWQARCLQSYMMLFEQAQASRGIRLSNLTFAELDGLNLTAADLGLIPADRKIL